MFNAKRNSQRNAAYATTADFYRIFTEDMDGLYALSLLLTADHETAERCFVSGIDECVGNSQIFKDWAESWARRTIIRNAVRAVTPHPLDGDGTDGVKSGVGLAVRSEIAAVLELRSFERFVFVMSVLEHYSDHECSVLLGCARSDVIAARTRALQQIGSLVALPGQTRTPELKDRSAQPVCRLDDLNVAPLARPA